MPNVNGALKDTLQKMLQIQKSRLMMGQPSNKKDRVVQLKQEVTDEMKSQFIQAVKSAQSKFDHQEIYFEKGKKGF